MVEIQSKIPYSFQIVIHPFTHRAPVTDEELEIQRGGISSLLGT